ncbi:MAG: hypothetical protein [Bacteriophage sp.]|nr:MAG: hypothetical protein [Bacteriophage sp.]
MDNLIFRINESNRKKRLNEVNLKFSKLLKFLSKNKLETEFILDKTSFIFTQLDTVTNFEERCIGKVVSIKIINSEILIEVEPYGNQLVDAYNSLNTDDERSNLLGFCNLVQPYTNKIKKIMGIYFSPNGPQDYGVLKNNE